EDGAVEVDDEVGGGEGVDAEFAGGEELGEDGVGGDVAGVVVDVAAGGAGLGAVVDEEVAGCGGVDGGDVEEHGCGVVGDVGAAGDLDAHVGVGRDRPTAVRESVDGRFAGSGVGEASGCGGRYAGAGG